MFAILTAVIIVFGMRIMGTLLISSLIVFPALSSMRLFNKFKLVIISSAIISVTCFLMAFFLFPNFPSGASVVVINLFVFVCCTIIGYAVKLIKKY